VAPNKNEKNKMLEKKLVRRFQNKDKRRFKTSFCFLFMFFFVQSLHFCKIVIKKHESSENRLNYFDIQNTQQNK
jgi:hypothetical protein